MNFRKIALIVLALAALQSCGTYQRLGYIQDTQLDASYSIPERPSAQVAVGDKISILVSCAAPTLAAPFNIVSGVYSMDPNTRQESVNVHATAPSYEVDSKGEIVFPVLGTLKVAGLTLKGVKNLIEEKIIEKSYIKEPVVQVEFVNFQVTMLGEVGRVGVIEVKSGSINIFEAIAQSGDLTQDAQRDNIWVVRTTNGKRQTYSINLKTKDCFYSPVYYLQQNDMVYVPPVNSKNDVKMQNASSWLSVVLTAISSIITTTIWVNYMTK